MLSHHLRRRLRWPAAVMGSLALALVLSACADADDETDADPATEEQDDPVDDEDDSAGDDGEESGDDGQPYQIAYLSASSANTWLQASLVEMNAIAAENNAEITEFDAQFEPGAQAGQVQDVITSGQYDAIIISSVDGAGIIPDLEEALDAGLEVGILNQIVGDALDTAEPQFDGPAVSALAPPLRSGERFGEMTLEACEGISPCNVVYFYGIRGVPIDIALREGFDDVTAANPDITVVAEAEGQYLGPDVALAEMQDVLSRTQDIDVVVGPDQSIQGVQLALEDAGIEGVALIGLGGSEPAFEGIRAGTWFGTVYGAPATEGQIVIEGILAALRDGTMTGGVDPLSDKPDGGLVTADNVDEFEAQWAG